MVWLIGFFGAFALVVFLLVRATRKAGPRQLSEAELSNGRTLIALDAEDGNGAWQKLGSRTISRGLDLRFDHDDDPHAEATLLVPGAEGTHTQLANRVTVRLGSEFETHHVHTSGAVFRVQLRGTGGVIGKQTIIQMIVDANGRPYGGRIENDDDIEAAVGDWIEVRRAEILEVERAA